MEIENSQFPLIDRPWVNPSAKAAFIDGNSRYGSLNALNSTHLSIVRMNSGNLKIQEFVAGAVKVDFPMIASMPSDVGYRFCYNIRGNISLSPFSTIMYEGQGQISGITDPIRETSQFIAGSIAQLVIMPLDSLSTLNTYLQTYPDQDPIQYLDLGQIPYTLISTFSLQNKSAYQQTLQQMIYSTDNQAYVLPRGYCIAYIYKLMTNGTAWMYALANNVSISDMHVECDIFAQLEMDVKNIPQDDTEAS